MQYLIDASELPVLENALERLSALTSASTDAQLTRILGVGSSSIATWRRRATVPYDVFSNYCNEEGLSINWLLFGKGPKTLQEASESEMVRLVRTAGEVLGDSMTAPALAFVPFYDVAVAAGHGREVLGEDAKPSAYNAYRKSWLDSRGLSAKQLIELPVVGDSMEDELRSGDTVLVDTSVREIRGGSIYVLRQGDDLIVKYLQQLPGGDVMVTSANSAAYPPYTIQAHYFETGEAEIIGRVVRQGRDR